MIKVERFGIYSGAVGWTPDDVPISQDERAKLEKYINDHPEWKLISAIPDPSFQYSIILFFDVPDRLKERDGIG